MNNLCMDFLNSEFRDFRGRWLRDDLFQPAWREQWLQRWHLEVHVAPDPQTMIELMALRRRLRRCLEALIQQGGIAEDDFVALNELVAAVPLHRQLLKGEAGLRVHYTPTQKDWRWVQAEIVASFAELINTCDIQRLRICANEHCRWVFYDETRSRTQRFCTQDKCANLWKVRRFRARQKEGLQQNHAEEI